MTLDSLYTKKQTQIFKRTRQEDWFMLINHGAVRAGKTQLDNDLFLNELIRVKELAAKEGVDEPMYILGGVSSGTIQSNVLQEITNKYGIEFKFDKHNNFKLFGVKVIQTFTGTIAGLKSIRGMTAYGAYINEASLANKEVFDEIIKRCSGAGARIIADTNPDHPEHWLKKNYIDNPSKNILSFHFTIKDNTFLSERYINNIIETTPSGMFTERGIFGLWTIGEGAIYSDFDEKIHVIDEYKVPWKTITKYYAGVDWGYEHWGSIVVIGETDDGIKYLIREYAAQHKDIDYWVSIAKEVVREFGGKIPFYCDSARPEHVVRFVDEGFYAYNANKAVLSGIEMVAKGYKQNMFFIVRQRVERFLDEVYQYVWNSKTGEPVKQNDDVQDSVRYAIYSNAMDSGGWLY